MKTAEAVATSAVQEVTARVQRITELAFQFAALKRELETAIAPSGINHSHHLKVLHDAITEIPLIAADELMNAVG